MLKIPNFQNYFQYPKMIRQISRGFSRCLRSLLFGGKDSDIFFKCSLWETLGAVVECL